ncbi:MAG: hypothetical protein ACR2PL_23620 [Dehalococcoidia bacterium]
MPVRRLTAATALFAILLGLLGAACSAGSANPHIDAITPDRVAPGTHAQLLVSGSGFRKGDMIRLNQRELSDSTWVNGRSLSAGLPADLAAGRYDVVVSAPDGRQAMKPAALLVGAPTQAKQSSPSTSVRTPLPSAVPAATKAPAPASAGPRTPVPTSVPVVTRATIQPAPATVNVSGQWHLVDTITSSPEGPFVVNFPAPVVLSQQGDQVVGEGSGIASLQGTLTGATLVASYTADNGTSGTFIWMFSADGASFSGTFTSTAPNSGTSAGTLLARGTLTQSPGAIELTRTEGQPTRNQEKTRPGRGRR